MSRIFDPVSRFYASSIGKKVLVAVSGLLLALFLVGHLAGNLLIFVGPEAINEYGHTLHTLGHGGAVWVARIGLLALLVVHVVATIDLTRQNRAARGDNPYGMEATRVASPASRIMIYSGLTVLAFVIYHLLHFTVRAGNDYNNPELYSYTLADGVVTHNVFKMVIDGFSWAPAAVFYIVAMILLGNHLAHGMSSLFQTLGLATNRTWPVFQKAGLAFTALIVIGNCSIPISIWLFNYGR
jgi:succinate dehydrogenase / fumarate reductase cytochrome b subunit